MNWDDVRIFGAVVEAGSVASAAIALRVNASTITRRVRALEEALGVQLFDRLSSGYRLTPAGRAIADRATIAGNAMAEVLLEAGGRDAKLEGSVRLTTLTSLGAILAPILCDVLEAHPQIVINLVTDFVVLDLSRRETDIAIRVTRAPPPSLFGRRLAPVGIGTYIAPHLLERYLDHDAPLPWLGTEGEQRPNDEVLEVYPNARLVGTFSRLLPAVEACAAGLGATRIPYFAARDSRLAPIADLDVWTKDYALWILTHETLRKNARVRTLMKLIGEAIIARSRWFSEPWDGVETTLAAT